MGDMADLIADYGFDGDWDPKPAVCKHCGCRDLYWSTVSGRWALVTDDGVHHVCPHRQPAKPEEFPLIGEPK